MIKINIAEYLIQQQKSNMIKINVAEYLIQQQKSDEFMKKIIEKILAKNPDAIIIDDEIITVKD